MTQCVFFMAFIACVGMVSADLGNSNPENGACLCVTARRLNIRAGAGTSHRIVKVATYGECFKYADQKTNASGSTWYRLDHDEEHAWATGRYLEIGSSSQCPATPPEGSCMCVTATRLNLRSGAGTSYRIVRVASEGECLKFTNQKSRASGSTWYRLDNNGEDVWATARYLVIGSPSQCPAAPTEGSCMCVTATRLNMRIGAGTSHRIARVANVGECFKYTDQKSRASGSTWYRLDNNGEHVWATARYLVTGLPSQCPAAPPEGSCMCVTATRLNMRNGASTSSRILTTANRGQCYEYTDQRLSANGYSWLSLNLNGQAAWAAERYLMIGSPSQCPAGPPEGSCMCVTATRLNMRLGANASGEILTTVNHGQCYEYTNLRQSGNGYFWLSLNVSGQEAWAAERFLRLSPGLMCEPQKDTYKGCTGSGTVDYRRVHVSDPKIRNKLEEIADYFCTRLWVISGDRNWGTPSLHDVNRAADFWLDGFDAYNYIDGVKIWDGLRESGLFNDEGWEVVWHGYFTCSHGIHFQIGRYINYRDTCFIQEGTGPSNSCIWTCQPL